MRPRRSHTVALLTKLTSMNRNFKWTEVEQDAFDNMKRIVVRDTLLTYRGFNEIFKIYTNASEFQLGEIISNEVKPIALYSRKFTDSQQQYTVTKIEPLSILETLKEFRKILFGQKLQIYTEHKNLRVHFYSRYIIKMKTNT